MQNAGSALTRAKIGPWVRMSAAPSPVFAVELCEDGCPVRPSLLIMKINIKKTTMTEEITADDRAEAAETTQLPPSV